MSDHLTGGCLCGAVRYEASGEPRIVADCYCIDCRKASGTSHGTHIAVDAADFSVTGELRFYDRPADSGNVVSRGFCPDCGSPIFSKNSAMPALAFIRASSLDDPNVVSPRMTVYASRAPKWARIDTSTPVFETVPEGGPKSVLKD